MKLFSIYLGAKNFIAVKARVCCIVTAISLDYGMDRDNNNNGIKGDYTAS